MHLVHIKAEGILCSSPASSCWLLKPQAAVCGEGLGVCCILAALGAEVLAAKRFQGMRLALSNNDYAFVRAGSMPLSIGRLRLPYAMMH